MAFNFGVIFVTCWEIFNSMAKLISYLFSFSQLKIVRLNDMNGISGIYEIKLSHNLIINSQHARLNLYLV